jgi:putative oxidoreductase
MEVTTTRISEYAVPIGRILFSLIFIISGASHFRADTIDFAVSQGLPGASFMVPLSGLLIILGGFSVALGYLTRWGAVALLVFLVPITLIMHNFWIYSDPALYQMQLVNFLKNLGLMGGALFLLHYGAGPLSVDRYLKRGRAFDDSVGTSRPI